jgi:hypothetical protein
MCTLLSYGDMVQTGGGAASRTCLSAEQMINTSFKSNQIVAQSFVQGHVQRELLRTKDLTAALPVVHKSLCT